jgi:hypothetical protein
MKRIRIIVRSNLISTKPKRPIRMLSVVTRAAGKQKKRTNPQIKQEEMVDQTWEIVLRI